MSKYGLQTQIPEKAKAFCMLQAFLGCADQTGESQVANCLALSMRAKTRQDLILYNNLPDNECGACDACGRSFCLHLCCTQCALEQELRTMKRFYGQDFRTNKYGDPVTRGEKERVGTRVRVRLQ